MICERDPAVAGISSPASAGPDHRTAAYLDTQLQGQVVSEPADLTDILAAWENVRGEAMSHRQSIDLVREVAETWT
ncbi:hypothetical protein E0H26_04095 [Micromonospora zingiberis]|uniref:DUF5753 domain-containing protein n=1 Tax=Micromonospora zingiberis TaxID=2053011 RepID=A0A4R0GRX3_9ACTN|nr:hypothetical protein E0H26_04095 [Micromonospora zingiberis]